MKLLTEKQKRSLRGKVKRAEALTQKAREAWRAVGAKLDEFDSHGHSQCCPVGGMMTGARSGFSGIMPCPCGWVGD